MQKVLIVRFSSIGDIVLTTPVVRCLHQQLDCEVHFLTKRQFAGILEPNPYIKRVWTIEKKVREIGRELKSEGFDAVIDLHVNLRTLDLSLLLRLSKFYRFNKLNFKKYLLTRWKINRMPDVHIVERYLAAAAPLGIKNDDQGLDYFVDSMATEVARGALAALLSASSLEATASSGGFPDYTAFVIGAAHATKRLTETQMIEVCQGHRGLILLLGGPAERAQGERIAAAAGHQVINTCGHFKLNESAVLVRESRVVISHDTGLMHIAAAFRKPIISVWGNTVPDLGMYPYLPGEELLEKSRRVETLGLDCRPCSKIGHQECPRGHFRCIRDIEAAEILERLDTIK